MKPIERQGLRPHIVVINRWQERYAEYGRYLDHEQYQVSYISTAVGLASVPPGAAATVVVDATDDLAAVRAAVRDLAVRHGAPAAVVALKEDDLLVGAQLRQEWQCPGGPRPHDLVVFRDKGAMCQAIHQAGLAVPAFAEAHNADAVRDFAADHGWPVIVKPHIGSSSAGVVRLERPADLAAVNFDAEPLLVQAYCADPIYHVDGVFDGSDVVTYRASRYLNTCLGFRSGSVLGSVEEDDPVRHNAIGEAATRFLAALSEAPTVFHLEIFVGADSQSRPVCTFLEVGARTGGAEIPFVWRELHGYDLMEAAMRTQLGWDIPSVRSAAPSTGAVGGWLLVPAPAGRPCRITEATPMVGRVPGPYAESVLRPGQILPAADAYYEHVGGRFRFRGATSSEVEHAIVSTALHYRVAATPVPHTEAVPA
ncbi:ATP-grasp domain-containing protein [Mycobacterium sp. MMS18-G62]